MHILDLPTELLSMIVDSSPMNCAISLRYSCRSFYESTGKAHDERCSRFEWSRSSRFERLCMDEQYRSTHCGEFVCSACEMCHCREQFSGQQILEKGPFERICKGAQRLLVITPTNSWSYQSLVEVSRGSKGIRMRLESGQEAVKCYLRDRDGTWFVMICLFPDISRPRC